MGVEVSANACDVVIFVTKRSNFHKKCALFSKETSFFSFKMEKKPFFRLFYMCYVQKNEFSKK